jgi:hypothetical protein
MIVSKILTKLRKVATELYARLFPQQRKNIPATIINNSTVEEINHTFRYNDLAKFLTITADTHDDLYFCLAFRLSLVLKVSHHAPFKNPYGSYCSLLLPLTDLIRLTKLHLNFLLEEKVNYQLNACLNNPISGGPLYDKLTQFDLDLLEKVRDKLTIGLDSPTMGEEHSKIMSTLQDLINQNSKSNQLLIPIKFKLDKIAQAYNDFTRIEFKFISCQYDIVKKAEENYDQNINILDTYLASLKSLNKKLENLKNINNK